MVSRFVAYPAADPNTLSVSATDVPASGDPTDVRSASFANVGPHRGPSTSRKERRAASRRLRETARPVPNLAPAESRHGLLDIQAALQNDQPEDEPADVLTDDAELRDDIFRGEAAARGSWLATFL